MSYRCPFTTNYVYRHDLVKKEDALKKIDELLKKEIFESASVMIQYEFVNGSSPIWYIQGFYSDLKGNGSKTMEGYLNDWTNGFKEEGKDAEVLRFYFAHEQ